MASAGGQAAGPHEAYTRLLSPLQMGPLALRNRLVLGSMHTRLPLEGEASAALREFYVERARGGAALIITGGVAPNQAGRMEQGATVLAHQSDVPHHARVVTAVHEAGSAIVMQILHAGRYAKHSAAVGPSSVCAPINRFAPRQLNAEEIEHTIEDYVRCALLAQEAGYDGVDIMGSEGYLINQFTAKRTNDRNDDWGGTAEHRMRFALVRTRESTQGGRDALESSMINQVTWRFSPARTPASYRTDDQRLR